MKKQISLMTDEELLQVVDSFESLENDGALPDNAPLRVIAGKTVMDMVVFGLYCYRELYLRKKENDR